MWISLDRSHAVMICQPRIAGHARDRKSAGGVTRMTLIQGPDSRKFPESNEDKDTAVISGVFFYFASWSGEKIFESGEQNLKFQAISS